MFDEEKGGFGGGHPHVVNLGHGMMPTMDPDMMKWFLEAVKEEGGKAVQRAVEREKKAKV